MELSERSGNRFNILNENDLRTPEGLIKYFTDTMTDTSINNSSTLSGQSASSTFHSRFVHLSPEDQTKVLQALDKYATSNQLGVVQKNSLRSIGGRTDSAISQQVRDTATAVSQREAPKPPAPDPKPDPSSWADTIGWTNWDNFASAAGRPVDTLMKVLQGDGSRGENVSVATLAAAGAVGAYYLWKKWRQNGKITEQERRLSDRMNEEANRRYNR